MPRGASACVGIKHWARHSVAPRVLVFRACEVAGASSIGSVRLKCVPTRGFWYVTHHKFCHFARSNRLHLLLPLSSQVLEHFSPKLNEEVTWQVSKRWLVGVPCFMCVVC